MENKVVIDGIGIEDMGVYLLENSYPSVLQYHKLKPIESNDWAEYDGIEPDLSDPTLDVQTITLNLHAKGEREYEHLLEMLLASGYRVFYFPELGIEKHLRLDTNSIDDYFAARQSFSLTFIDDNPDTAEVGGNTPQTWATKTDITIDDLNLSDWGITVLDGTIKNLVSVPPTKKRLFVSENSMNGAIYDVGGDVKTKERNATLYLLMRADTIQHLIGNYYGFLNFLVQSDTRRLELTRHFSQGDAADTFLCYYTSQTVDEVMLAPMLTSGMHGIKFDLNICITEKVQVVDYLTTDEGELLMTDFMYNLIK